MPEPTPDRAAGAEPPTWSVRELAASIADRLQAAFPGEVWVRGEIHDLSRARSGHVYFTLVDDEGDTARLSVMLPATNKVRVNRLLLRAGGRVRMTDGTDVRIRGRIDFYGPRGQLQLRMTSIDPAFTLGQLAAARAELLERLASEDLLERNGRLPLPLLPLRVGVVTSAGSAAEADVLDELLRSGYAFEVLAADVRVQGADAPASVADAIAGLATEALDVVIVARGGGATTDLAAFDHELVARAIAGCPHPVITGVGHEVDRTVADEVAHTAAKTPTAAAQHLVGIVARAHHRVEAAHAAVVAAADRHLRAATIQLDRLAARASTAAAAATRAELGRIDHARERLARGAAAVVDTHALRLERDGRRLRQAARRRVEEAAQLLDVLGTRVALSDPRRALARGWSITRLADGTVLRSISDIAPGTTLQTTLVDGVVTSVARTAAPEPTPPPATEDES